MPAILKEICGARKGVVNEGTKTLREHLPINLVPNNRSRLRIFTLKILLMYTYAIITSSLDQYRWSVTPNQRSSFH